MRLISYIFLAYTSGILLCLWIQIWLYGYGGFYEDNIAIRLFETISWAAFVLLGITMTIRHILDMRRR